MKQLLPTLLVALIGLGMVTDEVCAADRVQVDNKGVISADGIKAQLIHFGAGWSYSSQSNSCRVKKTGQASGTLQFNGTYHSQSGDFDYQEKVVREGVGAVLVDYSLTSDEGVETKMAGVSIKLPIGGFAGQVLLLDGKPLMLPAESPGQQLASTSVQEVIIPTKHGKVVVSGKHLSLYIQDDRAFKGNTFDLRFSLNGVKPTTTAAKLQLRLQAFSPQTDALDISKAANMGFADEVADDKQGGWTDQGRDNDLSAMKVGKRAFGAVTFDILDPAKNGGKSAMIFSGPGRPYFLATATVPASGEVYRMIYLLHASAWTPAKGKVLGTIVTEYADGSREEIPVASRVDCNEWWGATGVANAGVAWTTENTQSYVGLYVSRFKLSAKPLTSVTLKGSGKGVWMVAGISVSTEDIPLPREEPVYNTPGKEWAPLAHSFDVEADSILDFSSMVTGPAGQHGFVTTTPEGHFSYENAPDKRVKFLGGNLCFGANYVDHQEADRLAERFKRMGWNSVRFHHYDVELIGGWNARRSDQIDAQKLDRLDYLFAAMKKAGMSVTIDLYTIRKFGPDEIPEIKAPVQMEIKGLLPVLPSAFTAWSAMVEKLMNHVNPYTGLAWKDDPALFSYCPLNEDTITHVWKSTPELKAIYLRKYDEWLTANMLEQQTGELHEQQFTRFLIETKLQSNRQLEDFFEQLGAKALITGSNFISGKVQTFMRAEFDFVDNHAYWDHPSFPEKKWSLPYSYSKGSVIKSFGQVPGSMMPTRIFGKPFTVTEYNYCPPNRYRAEGGPIMGAYAALQDWDGLYRFAWAHNRSNAVRPNAISGFDISTDPLSLLGERIVTLLFARGDVSPGKKRVVYPMTMQDAVSPGSGWDKLGFPSQFARLGLVTQIGSQAIYDRHPQLVGQFDLAVSQHQPDRQALNGVPWKALDAAAPTYLPNPKQIISDTGQIELFTDAGKMRVVTPKTECLVMQADQDLAGDALSVTQNSTFATVAAAAMDGGTLAQSKRVLLFHMTDVSNTNMRFRTPRRNIMETWGKLPHLVRRGTAQVSLLSEHPNLTLWAVDMTGKRLDIVPTTYSDGRYQFVVDTAPHGKPSRLVYELSEAP